MNLGERKMRDDDRSAIIEMIVAVMFPVIVIAFGVMISMTIL